MISYWVRREYSENSLAKVFLAVLWIEYVLLCISILTTKQHYLFDLFTGVLTAVLAWKLFEYALGLAERHSPSIIAEGADWV